MAGALSLLPTGHAVPRTAAKVGPGVWERQVNTGVSLHFSFEFANPKSFAGSITHRAVGELGLFGVACLRHTVHRRPDDLSLAADASFLLTLQLAGTKQLTQDGRATTLRAGEFALYDSEQPLTLDVSDDYRSVNVRFRKAAVGAHDAAAFTHLVARKFSAEHGIAPVVWSAVLGLGSLAPAHQPAGILLAGNVLDMTATMLRAHAGLTGPAEPDDRLRRRQAVLACIDQRLPDPDLRVETIAAACFVSVRHLHALFRDSGHTVAGWIRHRRVEACKRDLADPAARGVPVAAIGARWGFGDPSHFGQVFKAVTGLTPAEFRRRALA
ncbi:helix-turn-helix domain-containing protein [Amycolatopsis sp. Hca4]|uniref:helix-turn-helix domain-containing protein n=1 Tax=Amycolatopsis sp. Hca4 TaxID=2742131 RepID=UPI00159172E4|nr:helix-turn-helix domain-containing protein [Amycolatopsis sp. Hca4]QKV72708.1 helix-turn-helix domain-containing protein [Amycolatopsis sp. Hca4]